MLYHNSAPKIPRKIPHVPLSLDLPLFCPVPQFPPLLPSFRTSSQPCLSRARSKSQHSPSTLFTLRSPRFVCSPLFLPCHFETHYFNCFRNCFDAELELTVYFRCRFPDILKGDETFRTKISCKTPSSHAKAIIHSQLSMISTLIQRLCRGILSKKRERVIHWLVHCNKSHLTWWSLLSPFF